MITSQEFRKEVQDLASEIGVSFKEVHLRPMSRKWASCSTRGRLTFNLDLLRERHDTIREVVVHELLHVRYPNHGKMFQSLLKAYTSNGKHVHGSLSRRS